MRRDSCRANVRWTTVLILALGLSALAAIPGAGGLLTEASAQEGEKTPRLLLLPFSVHSNEDPDYLRDGLSDMLVSRFARIGALELVRADGPEQSTSRLSEAIEAGRRQKADFVLFGSFTRFGRGASLDVQCAPVGDSGPQDPLREIFVHSGSIGEIIPDLDELAGKVSRFARGEQIVEVPSGIGGGVGGGSSSGGGGAAEYADLLSRIEALEAAFTDVIESQEGGEDVEELR